MPDLHPYAVCEHGTGCLCLKLNELRVKLEGTCPYFGYGEVGHKATGDLDPCHGTGVDPKYLPLYWLVVEECRHKWVVSNIVVDTFPETYHRHCECGAVESKSGGKEWERCFESHGTGYVTRSDWGRDEGALTGAIEHQIWLLWEQNNRDEKWADLVRKVAACLPWSNPDSTALVVRVEAVKEAQ
jgi:hypothetical protein